MISKIYAIKFAGGKEVARKEIGTARMCSDRTISARKYNELKRSLFNAYNIKRGEVVVMMTDDRLQDSFGGYPATGFVRFVRCTND